MTATVRSVRVVMEADTAAYVAKMRMAGRETSAAFDSSSRSVAGASRQIDAASTSSRRLEQATREAGAGVRRTAKDIDGLGRSTVRLSNQLDTTSGRARILVDTLAMFGPAAVPVGALAVPAVAGLGAQLGFTVAAAGAAVLAFQGVGDGLKALERARLEPTIENLAAARDALDQLSPAAQSLVTHLHDLGDGWRDLRNLAAEGMFPSLERGLDALKARAPELRAVVDDLARTGGQLFETSTISVASDRWDDFFIYIDRNARPILDDTASAVGSIAHGLGELFAATAPMQRDFTNWLRSNAEDFDQWADRLAGTDNFTGFVDYVRTNGPKAADAAAAVAGAVGDVVEAAAPLGGPALEAIEGIADGISAIADSNLGTPLLAVAAGLAAVNRVQRLMTATGGNRFITRQYVEPLRQVRRTVPTIRELGTAMVFASHSQDTLKRSMLSGSRVASDSARNAYLARERVRDFGKAAGPAAGQAALLGVSLSGVGEGAGIANTAVGALVGSMGGPLGAAIGGTIGGLLDLVTLAEESAAAVDDLNTAIESGNAEQLTTAIRAAKAELADPNWLDRLVGNPIVGMLGESRDEFLAGSIADAEGALARLEEQTINTDGAAALLGRTMGMTGDQVRAASGDVRALSQSFAELTGWLDKREALRNYEDALDTFVEKLKEAPRNFDIDSLAGRLNQDNLDEIADSVRQVAYSLSETPVKRNNFIRNAIEELRTIANSASPAAASEIRKVIRQLRDLGSQKPAPSIDVDTGPARQALGVFERMMNQATRPRSAFIDVFRRDHGAPTPTDPTLGGFVKPRKKADGGYIDGPGGPRDDVIPAWLSNGEYVIQASAVDRYGVSMLDAINAERFADGGMVGRLGATRLEKRTDNDPARISYIERVAGGFFIELLNGAAFQVTRETLDGFKGWKPALAELREEMEGTSRVLKNGRTRLTSRGMGRLLDLTGDPDANLRRIATLANVASLKQLERALKDSQEALDAETQARDSMVSSISSGLTRDWFDNGSGSPWSDDHLAGSPMARIKSLQQQIADANEFEALRTALQGRGLSGPAYDALVGRGDVEELRMWAQATPEQLAQFNALVPAAQGRVSQVAAAAGGVNYRGDIAALAAQVAALRREQQERHRQAQKARKDAPKATGKALNQKAGQGRQKKR